LVYQELEKSQFFFQSTLTMRYFKFKKYNLKSHVKNK